MEQRIRKATATEVKIGKQEKQNKRSKLKTSLTQRRRRKREEVLKSRAEETADERN